MLELFEAMKTEVENIEVPEEEKERAKECIDDAIVKAKSNTSDKKSIGDSLENAGKVLEGASKTALKATAFGHMLSQGLIWAGKAIGWL